MGATAGGADVAGAVAQFALESDRPLERPRELADPQDAHVLGGPRRRPRVPGAGLRACPGRGGQGDDEDPDRHDRESHRRGAAQGRSLGGEGCTGSCRVRVAARTLLLHPTPLLPSSRGRGMKRERGTVSAPVNSDHGARVRSRTPSPGGHVPVTKPCAAARKRSFSAGAPIDTRTPSPAKQRTITRCSRQCASKAAASPPRGSHTKLACDSGTAYPIPMSASRTRERSATTVSVRARSSSPASRHAIAADWASELTENGRTILAVGTTRSVGPTMYPTRTPARPYALEKVRSDTTVGREVARAMPSAGSSDRTYST